MADAIVALAQSVLKWVHDLASTVPGDIFNLLIYNLLNDREHNESLQGIITFNGKNIY